MPLGGKVIKRRSFLGLMAGAPVAAPAIVKDLVEVGVESAGIAPTMPLGNVFHDTMGEEIIDNNSEKEMSRADLVKLALKTPALMKDIEELARRRSEVNKFDPDLAVNRSMSLAAKFAIQRKRNYDAALHKIMTEDDPPWQRIYKLYRIWI